IYADLDNILAPNMIFATAIEIDAGGSLSSITNIGTISAIITARTGEVVAIRDASGTLIEINNSGFILAQGINSDFDNLQATNFSQIAIDVSANTSGVTINQTVFTNPDTNVDTTPTITGDVLLGSGDDVFNISGGFVNGDIDFGGGNDRIELSNSALVTGAITDSDGQLDIIITDKSRLNITAPANLNATTLTVDGTSIYSPFINPVTGEVSTLMASGAVTFEDGSAIAPRLSTVLSSANATFTIVQAGSLNIDTAISSVRSDQTPFLYNTTFSRSLTDANTLIMTLDVRSAQELGLDVPQEALFSSAFEALQNTGELGSAFVAITEQSAFNSAYNQLLPEFAAASRQFVMANVDGATGAVASHLDTARRSQDKTGGAWIQEFAYYADRELAGLSEQFRGYGFGITGGFDTEIGPFHTVGLNFGFATTEIEDVLGQDDPLDVLTLQFGTYAGYQSGALGVDLYAGIGYNDFEANRTVNIGTFNQQTVGDWSGTHYNASVKAGYDVSFGKYYVRPAATFSYLSLNEKAYTESGTTGIELSIDERTVNTGTASVTIDFGARFERENSWIAPAIRIGYRNDIISDGVITTGRFVNGTTPFSLLAADFPDSGFLLGVTFATGTGYASFSFDYDADIRNGFSRHTARLVLRMLF
ncbi:MAG: autotransporter domain-containing protein, partial [Robiginitomaculum sp.]|nr:autotransporter domain-containing protein [Robiginitomaculum sp.]